MKVKRKNPKEDIKEKLRVTKKDKADFTAVIRKVLKSKLKHLVYMHVDKRKVDKRKVNIVTYVLNLRAMITQGSVLLGQQHIGQCGLLCFKNFLQ